MKEQKIEHYEKQINNLKNSIKEDNNKLETALEALAKRKDNENQQAINTLRAQLERINASEEQSKQNLQMKIDDLNKQNIQLREEIKQYKQRVNGYESTRDSSEDKRVKMLEEEKD